jgi:regulator of RNase E activity RraA
MPSEIEKIFNKLQQYDTPSVTNVVATYPQDPLCLGLYNPWTQNWYTDQSVHCIYPSLGRTVGYAITCVFGLPDPGYSRLTFPDVIDAVEQSRKPVILVAKQEFPPEISGKVGLFGGNTVTALKSVGCIGLLSDGPSRDVDEIRPLDFQYMITGTTAGHGEIALHAINIPVYVAGMDVMPGEIVHMDENGACKFPAEKIESVVKNLELLEKEEKKRMSALSKATNSSQIRSIFSGHSYDKKK